MAAACATRVSFYIGGFEAVGGIESFFYDLLLGLKGSNIERSAFVWASSLPQLKAIENSGTRVFRTPLRSGSRYRLPDRLLWVRHAARLTNADKIVFGKFPPEDLFLRMVANLRRRQLDPELLYITSYRPREIWPEGVPGWIRDNMDTIVVQAPEFANDLRSDGFSGRIIELPYPPPAAAKSPIESSGKDQCILGFLGRFVPQKNLFYLLDLMEELKEDAVELHLIGQGAEEAQLRKRAADRCLPVRFLGPVERGGVAEAIDKCDIFINPSKSEGQCLVALEVLSRGRPLIATPVGAIPDILREGRFGATIPLGNVSAAAHVIRGLIREWQLGLWSAVDIVRDYRDAYQPDVIFEKYRSILRAPRLKSEGKRKCL